MIKIGCLTNYKFSYKEETDFARKNNFDLVQIWYDKNGIALHKDKDPIESIISSQFPSILHAVLDINDFEEHLPILFNIVKTLKHKDIIIHPVCNSEVLTDKSICKLSNNIKMAYELLSSNNINLFIENNSKLTDLFNSPKDIEEMFKENHNVKFILDIAHIESYKQLKKIVKIKTPEMLHVADKHFNIIHEHLPLGEGELDFRYIFTDILKNFEGNIILEIVQSKESIISSKIFLEDILKNI